MRFVTRPSGTVTLLFTDIEGSTRAWESHPAEMKRALARHDAMLRGVIEGSGGYVFKTVGDAFCAAFTDAASAVRTALAVQEAVATEPWPEVTPIRVRIAVHSGECEERDDDYFGPTVNRIARLLGVGHGGQILVSGFAAQLTGERLPDSASLRDLGEHRLKDLGRPERVFQLEAPGVASSFPALRSLNDPQLLHNLPEQMTTFVGRDRELAELRTLLESTRLLTLTGPGGTGKTRLALQAAAEQLDGSGDGVWLVDLSSLTDEDRLAELVASVLSVAEVPGRSIVDVLRSALRDQDRLIVLDNCEHVVDAAAKLIDILLQSCARLGVLATSRQALGIGGEVVFRVPPLALPRADDSQLGDVVSDAVRLFVERVRLHDRGFALDAANAPIVARVCRRLDGIPLAIELAAARVRSLTVAEVEARLDQRFRLLVGGSRSAGERQQTLRATIDWSHTLLSPAEQQVFARLSVFAGGFDLEAAEAVAADGDTEFSEMVEHLSALADKSLVNRNDLGTRSRYSLLETLQSYAADRLAEQGPDAVAARRTRHRDYELALAERAAPHLRSADQLAWLDELDLEHDNLRVAFVHALDEPDGAQAGLRFVVALVDWWDRGMTSDWLAHAALALQRPDAAAPSATRAVALLGVAGLHLSRGETSAARGYLDEAWAIAQALGDERLAGIVLCHLGHAMFQLDDLDAAREHYDNSLQRSRKHNDTRTEILALKGLGDILSMGEPDALAVGYYEQAIAAARVMGDPQLIARLCTNYGAALADWADPEAAEPVLTEALAIYRGLRHTDLVATNLSNLGFVSFLRGDWMTARDRHLEALQLTRRTNNSFGQAFALIGSAAAAFLTLDYARSTILHGVADSITEKFDARMEQPLLEIRAAQLDRSRAVLGENTFNTEYEAGRNLRLTDAISLVAAIGTPN